MKFTLKATHIWIVILLLTVSVYVYRIYARVQEKQPLISEEASPSFAAQEDQDLNATPLLDTNDSTAIQMPTYRSETWKTLMDIEYEQISQYGYVPVFKDKQKEMNGKTITIEGFMYPLEDRAAQSIFILSFYPIASCFFCGGAGPESVVEVNSPKTVKYTQRQVKIKGKLELNKGEPERLFYILQDAELVK